MNPEVLFQLYNLFSKVFGEAQPDSRQFLATELLTQYDLGAPSPGLVTREQSGDSNSV
ncbi:hypothetical protein EYZ11_010310 [Aspergillus tanneri]|uniref:Uncharacterized protein n=1 Tax=Aspergillus tanneri TaxID=1220188 RepID=A0A4S3J5P8_9EURO|nr:hypothetical protein EYZ11_010310 [Aspergillus tanneri]